MTEVPILAPIIIGMAFSILSAPAATIPTTIDVVEEELCTIEVARTPINKPTKGLVVVCINVAEKSFPNNFKESPISCKLRMNK